MNYQLYQFINIIQVAHGIQKYHTQNENKIVVIVMTRNIFFTICKNLMESLGYTRGKFCFFINEKRSKHRQVTREICTRWKKITKFSITRQILDGYLFKFFSTYGFHITRFFYSCLNMGYHKGKISSTATPPIIHKKWR